jgi:heme-degrading monooxygenase HmoA
MSASRHDDGPRVRILVWHRATEGRTADLEQAYHEISGDLRGTHGLLCSELMRNAADPGGFLVMSEWVSMAAFQSWEEGARHRMATAPLRPFRDFQRVPPFELYEITATL